MNAEILNSIRNRIIELDDLLWLMPISEYRDETELLKELDKLNKMLVIAEGV